MKIKIIELLTRIANGEKLSNKIKHCGIEYQKLDDDTFVQYRNKDGYCLDLVQILNDEVEIIEEDKPIEELKEIQENDCMLRYPDNEELMNKINELVKEINKLKENK